MCERPLASRRSLTTATWNVRSYEAVLPKTEAAHPVNPVKHVKGVLNSVRWTDVPLHRRASKSFEICGGGPALRLRRKAHMIRKNRGRPEGPAPVFVEDCHKLDATASLAKARGCFTSDEPGRYWTLSWPALGATET